MDASVCCQFFIAGVVLVVSLAVIVKRFRHRKVGDFGKKYVLITGCDSGFGKETAIRLDQLGFHVFATCLTKAGQDYLQSVCSNRVTTLALDVTDSQQIRQTYAKVSSLLPHGVGLWGLVNNAGVLTVGPLEWQSLQTTKRISDVNLWGLIDITVTFLPLLKLARGRVVNMSSIAGLIALPGFGAYCISKFGVEAFSDVLRREMRPWGVLVSIVEAAAFRTQITNEDAVVKCLEDQWKNITEHTRKEYGETFYKQAKDGYRTWCQGASQDTFKVTNAFLDAVTSSRPRPRYILNGSLLNFISKLPEFLSDSMIDSLLKNRFPKPAHA